MNAELIAELLHNKIKQGIQFLQEFGGGNVDSTYVYYVRVVKLMHFVVPLLTGMLFYRGIKYLLVFNACQYEEYARKRYGHMKKVIKQLRHLSKRYGNFYFYYMPMNHGTALPRTYSLFMAIKEVLINSNRPGMCNNLVSHPNNLRLSRHFIMPQKSKTGFTHLALLFQQNQNECNPAFPASRTMRTNLLMDLIRPEPTDCLESSGPLDLCQERVLFDLSADEIDPLSEFNLDIMKCSRELIIQGVKDFDVMSALYRVLEIVEEDVII